MSKVLQRDQWAQHTPVWRQLALPTPEEVVHHSGFRVTVPEDWQTWVREWERDYMASHPGYITLPYHTLVPSGGPHDGDRIRVRPAGKMGAATLTHNPTSHAICVMGNFDLDQPTEKALDGVAEECAEWRRNGYVSTRADGQSHGKMSGNSTSCCGDNLEAKLQVIERRIDSKLSVNRPPAPQPPGPLAHPVQNPVLRKGSRGPTVKFWQALLNKFTNAGLVVDGVFGSRTATATMNFQRFFGGNAHPPKMTVDGIVGPQTWGMMDYLLTH